MSQLNQCPQCGGKYGLTRHYYGRVSLCSMNCKDNYLNRRHIEKPPDELVELLKYPP